MVEKFTIENKSQSALLSELQKIHWGRYVDFAKITCDIKDGTLRMIYVEQSIKPL